MKPSDLLPTTLFGSPKEKLKRECAGYQRTIDAIPARLADSDAQEAVHETEGNKDGWLGVRVAREGILFDEREARRRLKIAKGSIDAIDEAEHWAKLPSSKEAVKTAGAAYSKAAYALTAAAAAYVEARQELCTEFPELAIATAALPTPNPLALDMSGLTGSTPTLAAPPGLLDFVPNLRRALASVTRKAG